MLDGGGRGLLPFTPRSPPRNRSQPSLVISKKTAYGTWAGRGICRYMPVTPLLRTVFGEPSQRAGQAKITFPGTFSAENLSITLGKYWRGSQQIPTAIPPVTRPVYTEPTDDRSRGPVVVIPRPPPPPVVIQQQHDLDQPPEQEEDMAIDWGGILTGAIGGAFGLETPGFNPSYFLDQTTVERPQAPVAVPTAGSGAAVSAGSCDGMAWTGGTPPKGYKVVNYCGQGVLRKVRRRRRRRLLTCSDKADIAAVVGMVGKGQLASSIISRIGCP